MLFAPCQNSCTSLHVGLSIQHLLPLLHSPPHCRNSFSKHIHGHVIPLLKNMVKCFLHILASIKLYHFNPSTAHHHATYTLWFCPSEHTVSQNHTCLVSFSSWNLHACMWGHGHRQTHTLPSLVKNPTHLSRHISQQKHPLESLPSFPELEVNAPLGLLL